MIHKLSNVTRGANALGFMFAAGIVASFALPTQPAAKDFPPAIAKLVKAAQAEGNLHLTWNTSFEGAKGSRKFEAAINKYYGTSIKIRHTGGGSFNANGVKLLQELKAGRKAFTDVALGGTGQVNFYVKHNFMLTPDWASLMPQVPADVMAKIIAPGNGLVAILSRVPTIVYNKNLIKPADSPKSMKDLLNPKWKGKIASTPYAAGFGVLGSKERWGKDALMTYAKSLAGSLGGLMRCGSYDRINSGEFPIFAIACQPGLVRKAIAKGAPLAQNLPLDALNLEYFHFGVPKHATNPNAATLYISFMLTPEGQKVIYNTMLDDLHYLKGSHGARLLDRARKMAGAVKFLDQNFRYLLAQTENSKYQRTVAKIFRETRKKK